MSWGVEELTVRFGDLVALDHVSTEIRPGVIHAVIGGDGAGKSTLLRVLAGLGLDSTGIVRLPSQDRIGFVPSAGGSFVGLTVGENMAFVAAAHHLRSWQSRASMLLERAGIATSVDRLSEQLSGGQRRKLAAAMALLAQPELLILDEVTTGVDPLSRMELWRLVAAAAAEGAAIVAATTYLDEAERAEQVQMLHEGRLLASGTPSEVIGGIPGAVTDEATPTDRTTAWRLGRRWHQWHADAALASAYRPSLEDAAIVYELRARSVIP